MPEPKKDTSNSIIKKVSIVLVFLLIFFGGYLFIKKSGLSNYFKIASEFISATPDKVKSDDGRVNILVLGKADKDHAGSDLTDTMIFVSISLSKPKVTLVSIPRDVWIPEIRAKINSAYYWGNQKEVNGGLALAKSTIQGILGVPAQYGLVIDFSGFKNVIDVLGGIEVDVQNSFTDDKYPIAGRENDLCDGDKEYKCRYETIKFEKGKVMMDGETALKFVRSRNAEGDEGTDIARESRQQLVINGVKNKILSFEILASPSKISALIDAVKSSIETDMDVPSASVVAKRILFGKSEVKSYLIPEELLINPPVSSKYDNQYVFIPKGENWLEVQKWFQSVIN